MLEKITKGSVKGLFELPRESSHTDDTYALLITKGRAVKLQRGEVFDHPAPELIKAIVSLGVEEGVKVFNTAHAAGEGFVCLAPKYTTYLLELSYLASEDDVYIAAVRDNELMRDTFKSPPRAGCINFSSLDKQGVLLDSDWQPFKDCAAAMRAKVNFYWSPIEGASFITPDGKHSFPTLEEYFYSEVTVR